MSNLLVMQQFNALLTLTFFVTLHFLTGCKSLQESSKYQFNEGFYNVKMTDSSVKAYIVTNEDSIKVYPLKQNVFDSTNFLNLVLPQQSSKPVSGKLHFIKNSFDLDLLTILFKYRPSVKSFPQQFNTNFNGAAYLGYRSDIFRVIYSKRPLYYKRRIAHYGYSYGAFLGMGATAMNPWVTQNNITEEYDGFIISKGLAINVAVNSFTFGIAIGIDHLTDRDRHVWIYQGKPWTGVTLGLNLN